MTKKIFIRRIIISSVLTAIAIALIITFCVCLFIQYTKPNEDNTSVSSGTVADIYHGGKKGLIVEMSGGEQFQLVYPLYSGELYSAIGYDLNGLSELLVGEKIEYRRMNMLPWVIEIYLDGVVIDNNELTDKQITATRICVLILGAIMLAFPVAGEIAYIKNKYKLYKRAEKKRLRKERRELRKT